MCKSRIPAANPLLRHANRESLLQIKNPRCKSRIRVANPLLRLANRESGLQIKNPRCQSRIRAASPLFPQPPKPVSPPGEIPASRIRGRSMVSFIGRLRHARSLNCSVGLPIAGGERPNIVRHERCRQEDFDFPVCQSTRAWTWLGFIQNDIRGPALKIPSLQFVSQSLVGNIENASRVFPVPVRLFQSSKNEFALGLFGRVGTNFL